jgi:uncharacterized glyoxalase superfamily protein PhnB
MTTFFPCVTYADAPAAIDWLERAFGFERGLVVPGDGDRVIAHAELRYGDGLVMTGSKRDDAFAGGTSVVYVAIGDIDAHCARAREAGAEILMEPLDTDYGSRDYAARDPEGNVWSFGTYRPEAGAAA